MLPTHLDSLIRLTPVEPKHADPAAKHASGTESFGDYLQRAGAQSAVTGQRAAGKAGRTQPQQRTARSASASPQSAPASRDSSKPVKREPAADPDPQTSASPQSIDSKASAPPQDAGQTPAGTTRDTSRGRRDDSNGQETAKDATGPKSQDDNDTDEDVSGVVVDLRAMMITVGASDIPGGNINGNPNAAPDGAASGTPVGASETSTAKQAALAPVAAGAAGAGLAAATAGVTDAKAPANVRGPQNTQPTAANAAPTMATAKNTGAEIPDSPSAQTVSATDADTPPPVNATDAKATTPVPSAEDIPAPEPPAGKILNDGSAKAGTQTQQTQSDATETSSAAGIDSAAQTAVDPVGPRLPSRKTAATATNGQGNRVGSTRGTGSAANIANGAGSTAAQAAALAGTAAPLVAEDLPSRDDRVKEAIESIGSADHTDKPASTSATGASAHGQGQTPTVQTSGGDAAAHGPKTADVTLSQADRVRFVQRVEQAFQSVGDQGGSVRLRLSPPELGSLRIEISVNKGQMNARVETETPAARNVLLDNLPALRERLAQHDINVQRFDVDLMDRSMGGSAGQTPQQYQDSSYRSPPPNFVRNTTGSLAEPQTADTITPRRIGEGGRLNIVV